MKTTIYENQRGLMFKQGKFMRMLLPGTHRMYGKQVEVKLFSLNEEFIVEDFELCHFDSDSSLMSQLDVVEVADGKLCLHYADGIFQSVLTRGKHAFWNVNRSHEFQIIDMGEIEVSKEISAPVLQQIAAKYCIRVEVQYYQKAQLYFDKKFIRLLDEGIYYFWKDSGVHVECLYIDMRLRQMEVNGQEMMSADKVTLRMNFICNYRVTNYMRIYREIKDYEIQIYTLTQLALREYVGGFRLDEILENKDELAEFVMEKLKEKEQDYGVEFQDAGVKDLILPGEIRDIMNTVLIAEKRAQANVITRREEVASTRSLLNTAKLMEENRILYKLKEMEYIERICDNIGNIELSGNGAILSQLMDRFRGTAEDEK